MAAAASLPAELAGLLEMLPLPALVLEPASLRPRLCNAEALALLAPAASATPEAVPPALAAAWDAALETPPHGPALRRRLGRLKGREVPESFETGFAPPGRPPLHLLLRARLVRAGGQDWISLGLVDLTTHHQTEQALSLAHRQAEVALAGADLGAWHWDRRLDVLRVSERWCSMLGLPPLSRTISVPDWFSLLHPDDLPWTRALLDRYLAGTSARYEAEFRMRHRSGRWVWILARGEALERGPDGHALVLTGTHLDLTAQRRAMAAQVESEREARRRLADLEMLYQAAPLGLAQLDREMRFVRINPALAEMNGLPPDAHLGRALWELLPDLRASSEPMLRRVLEAGETLTGVEVRGETPRAPGVLRDWVEQFYPVRDPESGEVTGVGIVCEEVTERKHGERARDLLVRELDHRVKNLFAIIGGLVSFTARTAVTPEAMRRTLLGRIEALARAHDLVRPAMAGGAGMPSGGGTTLEQLLASLLAPFRAPPGQPERLALAGPPLRLGHTAAPPIALAVHELATNAAKYGALSASGGAVRVAWTAGPGEPVVLSWEERGGPSATAPDGVGFGHRLVRQSCAQLGGEAAFDWSVEGLTVRLRLPVDRLGA
ncbi:sensor histidine kinase [Siccirubricoccus phaeus]|uniref:sensor histidine kinase n=1 Tax=Siccirubricoccus phaeus TaxID=2595053 RepID=UPI0011F34EEA|nr:PAS domain-containing protein [Siccirubricoccus phaeus]